MLILNLLWSSGKPKTKFNIKVKIVKTKVGMPGQQQNLKSFQVLETLMLE